MAKKTAKRPVAPDDLLRLRVPSDPQLSPDGRNVLFGLKTIDEKKQVQMNLWLVATEGGEPRQLTASGKDGAGRWSPDGKRIAFVSGRTKPKPQVHLLSLDGGEAQALTRFPEGSVGKIAWSPTGKHIAVAFREADPAFTDEARKKREESQASPPPRVLDHVMYRLDGDGWFNAKRWALHVVDAATGEARVVFGDNQSGGLDFDWSPDGSRLVVAAAVAARAAFEPWLDRLWIVDARSGKRREIPRLKEGSRASVHWSPDGRFVCWTGREGRDGLWGETNHRAFLVDPETGKSRALLEGVDRCLVAESLGDTREATFAPRLHWLPDGSGLLAGIGWHGETHVGRIDARSGDLRMLTSGAKDHALGNPSAEGSTVALLVGDALRPSDVHVGEIRGDRLAARKLTSLNDALLAELDLAPMEERWVRSKDGTRVHFWMMRPPASRAAKGGKTAAAKKTPALLNVHGGPHAAYGLTFFHEMQTLASAGFAVFLGNPRGSKGYGEEFSKAIRGRWGTVDWQDVQAISRYIREQPWIDAKRIGILGGSYGGYMTNWAIGHTDEFACAITDRCVSNLLSMSGSSDFPLAPDQYWKGGPWDRPETLWEQSPIRWMGDVKTPTLVIHSEGDLRCNVEQGEQVFTVLQYLGVPSRFVRYPTAASHGLSRGGPPDLRLHRLGQMLDWLGRWLKP